MARVATAKSGERGKVICLRCRRSWGGAGCRGCAPGGCLEARRVEVSALVMGLWLGGAALAGSLLGAALAFLQH